VPKIPALRRQRQKDHEFKASLGYRVRLCFKNRKSCINFHSVSFSAKLLLEKKKKEVKIGQEVL
jgi:hypothetical protein